MKKINGKNASVCLSKFVTEEGDIKIPESVKGAKNQADFIRHVAVICHVFVPAMHKHLLNWLKQAWYRYMSQDECCCGDISYLAGLVYDMGFKDFGDTIRDHSHCNRGPAKLDGSFDPWSSYLWKTHEFKRRTLGEPVLAEDEIAVVGGASTEGAAPGQWTPIYNVFSNVVKKHHLEPDCLNCIWASNALIPLANMTEAETTALATEEKADS